jgi:hypothetical protein
VDKAFRNLVTEIYRIAKLQQQTQATTALVVGKSTNPLMSQDIDYAQFE